MPQPKLNEREMAVLHKVARCADLNDLILEDDEQEIFDDLLERDYFAEADEGEYGHPLWLHGNGRVALAEEAAQSITIMAIMSRRTRYVYYVPVDEGGYVYCRGRISTSLETIRQVGFGYGLELDSATSPDDAMQHVPERLLATVTSDPEQFDEVQRRCDGKPPKWMETAVTTVLPPPRPPLKGIIYWNLPGYDKPESPHD